MNIDNFKPDFTFSKKAAFKSKAQRRKFYVLLREGKISKKEMKEWEDDTPDKIPERVGHEKKANAAALLSKVTPQNLQLAEHLILSAVRAKKAATLLDDLVEKEENRVPILPLPIIKTAGGPGSGTSEDNTKEIPDLPLTPYITIMKRKAFMESKSPFLKDRFIEMNNIKYVGQKKYVPAKVEKFIKAYKDKNDNFNPLEKAIDVTLLPDGSYAVLDGHHRFLVAKNLGKSNIKANIYTVTAKDKNSNPPLEKVAINLTKVLPALKRVPQGVNTFMQRVTKPVKKSSIGDTAKALGKGAYNIGFGGKTRGNQWDPLYGLKSIGKSREKYSTGPLKNMYKYDEYGDHLLDTKKSRNWMGYIDDEIRGASRTRGDLAAKQLAKQKQSLRHSNSKMNVGEYLDTATTAEKAHLQSLNQMKMVDFIKKHPKLAANYYGRNVIQKGLTVGFPAMSVYELASGQAQQRDPHSSKLGNTLGSLTEAAGWGLTGPLGLVGSLGTVTGASAAAKKLGNMISKPKDPGIQV